MLCWWSAGQQNTCIEKPAQFINLQSRIKVRVQVTWKDWVFNWPLGIAKQVHQPGRKNRDRIIMDNNSEYQKNLQDMFPCGPEKWTDLPSAGLLNVTEGQCFCVDIHNTVLWVFAWKEHEKLEVYYCGCSICLLYGFAFFFFFALAEVGRLEKGVRRWVGLPTKADYATELGLRPPDYNRQDTKVPKQPIHYSPMLGLSSLRYAVEGWRNAWKISEFLYLLALWCSANQHCTFSHSLLKLSMGHINNWLIYIQYWAAWRCSVEVGNMTKKNHISETFL